MTTLWGVGLVIALLIGLTGVIAGALIGKD